VSAFLVCTKGGKNAIPNAIVPLIWAFLLFFYGGCTTQPTYQNITEAGVKKLTNQALLADIAKNDKTGDVRVAAVKNLADQAILTEISEKDVYAAEGQDVIPNSRIYKDSSGVVIPKWRLTRDSRGMINNAATVSYLYRPTYRYPVRNAAKERLKELGFFPPSLRGAQ